MPFLYQRTIHFKDTDAAGVVYFANVLSICHEAYEASLQSVAIDLRAFFCDRHRAIPIVHVSVDFFQPMFCGESYTIELIPALIKPSEFSVTYQIYPHINPDAIAIEMDIGNSSTMDRSNPLAEREGLERKMRAKAHSRHVCIHPLKRKRLDLDDVMMSWLMQYGS